MHLLRAHQQAEQQRQQAAALQQQQQAQALEAWTKSESEKFDREVYQKESPETRQKLQAAMPEILEKDYGIGRDDLAYAIQHNPAMRSSAFQKIFLDAMKFRVAQREVVNKIDRSTPPIQRPGVSQPRGNDSGVESALKAFRANPGPQTGAALVAARRGSR